MVFVNLLDNLYIGDVEGSEDWAAFEEHGVRRVVNAAKGLPCHFKGKGVEYLDLELLDDGVDALFPHLPRALSFISAKAGEPVLVHCHGGSSRSGAICVAHLMATERIGRDAALERLRDIYAGVCPNELFMEELAEFEEMEFSFAGESDAHKRFRHKYPSAAPMPSVSAAKIQYSCRSCRTPLFTDQDVIPHEPKAQKTAKNKTRLMQECTSVFVEEMEWMMGIEEEVGRLDCGKCHAKLGGWSWHGMQCSCGAWQSPAFQVHLGKVDAMPIRR